LAIFLLLGQKLYTSTATVKDIAMADIIERVQNFEHKYGERAAAFAIVAMVVYLVIAQ
jgi:hypothetical protein